MSTGSTSRSRRTGNGRTEVTPDARCPNRPERRLLEPRSRSSGRGTGPRAGAGRRDPARLVLSAGWGQPAEDEAVGGSGPFGQATRGLVVERCQDLIIADHTRRVLGSTERPHEYRHPAQRWLARPPVGRAGRARHPQKAVLGLWDTVNNLTRLRPTKKDRYRVTISARPGRPGPLACPSRRRADQARVRHRHWRRPGLMAAQRGTARRRTVPHRNRSASAELPFEQDVNAFVTEAFQHKTFFTRLHHFVLVSDAFIVTPGASERY